MAFVGCSLCADVRSRFRGLRHVLLVMAAVVLLGACGEPDPLDEDFEAGVPTCPTPPQQVQDWTRIRDLTELPTTSGDWSMEVDTLTYNHVKVTATTQAGEGLAWSESIQPRILIEDFIRVIPQDGWPADGTVNLRLKVTARRTSQITTGDSQDRIEDDTAGITGYLLYFSGSQWEGDSDNVGKESTLTLETEFTVPFWAAYDDDPTYQGWVWAEGPVEGWLRTRGYRRTASATFEYRIEAVGVEDLEGNRIEALVCSASGTKY